MRAASISNGLVCVTGGLGFIGSHLCDALLDRGYSVRCVDRLGGRYAGGAGPDAAARLRDRGAEVAIVDLADADPDALLDGAAAVAHLAALPGVRTRRPFGDVWTANFVATERLVAAAARAGARLLLASTSSVYGDAVRLPTPEHAPPSPLSAYAISKLAAEGACRTAWRERGADAVVARLFTVYGPRQRPDMAFARWIAALADRRPLVWHARPGTMRDFTYVDDAVRGLVAALERGRSGESYNVSGGSPERLSDALALLESALGRRAQLRRAPAPSVDAFATGGCTAKARAELGYKPRVGLAEGLHDQLAATLADPPSAPRRSLVAA